MMCFLNKNANIVDAELAYVAIVPVMLADKLFVSESKEVIQYRDTNQFELQKRHGSNNWVKVRPPSYFNMFNIINQLVVM